MPADTHQCTQACTHTRHTINIRCMLCITNTGTHTHTHGTHTHTLTLRAMQTNTQNKNTHRHRQQAHIHTHTHTVFTWCVTGVVIRSEQGTRAAGHGDFMGAIFIYSCDDIRSFSNRAVEVGLSGVAPLIPPGSVRSYCVATPARQTPPADTCTGLTFSVQ